MKKITKIKMSKSRLSLVAGGLLLLLVTACVFLDEFSGPSSAKAGDELFFTVKMRVEPAEDISDTRLIVSFLAPDSWDPRTTVSMTYTSTVPGDVGVQTMSLIAQDVKPKNRPEPNWEQAMTNAYGVGPNALNSMKWVTFQSDKLYSLLNNQDVEAVVTIRAVAGPNNLKFIPGAFINHSQDGLKGEDHKAVKYYDSCFEVTDGTGSIINYCSSLGLNDYSKQDFLSPYPNPFYNEISIPLPGNAGDKTEVILTDLSGRTIFQKEITNASENFVWQAEMNNAKALPKGVYLVTLKAKSSSKTFKIIKK